MNSIKIISRWVRGYLSFLYPYALCLMGSQFFAITYRLEGAPFWVGSALSFVCFFFAIEVTEARAKAAATNETASRFIAFLTNGADSEINVYFHDKRETRQ